MVKRTIRKRLSKGIVCLLILVFSLGSTASSPVAFTIGDERELGEKLLYSVRSIFEIIDDPDITQYINRLGKSVLEVAGIQYFDYHFFVIDNKEFNAFAAPSGLIFFHSGLIGAMNSEDELVSVLAHEIGHIVKRHLASRIEKSKYSSIASAGLALAALAFGGSVTPALVSGALATGQSISLHFSRQNEEEADLLAYDWMKELHRNPEGQAKMLESMRRIARYRSEILPQYLLTHPNPEARLHYIESLLDSDGEYLEEMSGQSDDFSFFRFKYRILSKVKETQASKNYLASVVADKRASGFKKTMAEYGLSQVMRNENDYNKSLALLDKVISFFPDKNTLKVDRGVVEFEAGRFEDAEETLKRALQVDSSDMYATFTLGNLLYRTGRLVEAEKYYRTVSYELPEYAKVYFQMGQIASDNKQAGLSSFYLGKYNLYEGNLKQAEKSFKIALRYDNISEKVREESERLLVKTKKLQK